MGVNGTVVFLTKETLVHPGLRGAKLVTEYGLSEGPFVTPNKSVFMDNETWSKAVKVVAPGI